MGVVDCSYGFPSFLKHITYYFSFIRRTKVGKVSTPPKVGH